MDTLDRAITDLASAQGHALSNKDLKQVKQALSNTFIDSVLDGTKMAARATTPIDEEDAEEDVESDGNNNDDIMADDSAEDNTDEKGEGDKKRLTSTKVLTIDQPTSHSSAITGYRPGTSGMGQVG